MSINVRFAAVAMLAAASLPLYAQPVGDSAALEAQLAGVSPLSADELGKRIKAAQAEPFGSKGNPVRAEMPQGERAYIARLRCADGKPPVIGQRESAGVGVYGSILDVYPLDCGAATPGKVALHMDMYHRGHVETVAPPGFTIEPPPVPDIRN